MPWRIELDPMARRDLDKLDPPAAQETVRFPAKGVATIDDPGDLEGGPLSGPLH
jgi:mRNA-degrading endonuclease RelE of RelBE toxin-antitoxin system